jgi:hypothetical protein
MGMFGSPFHYSCSHAHPKPSISYLYVGLDGKLPFNMPTTAADPDDPFSGTGYLLDNLQYTSDELKALCEAIGPIESWREVSTYNNLNSSASSYDAYDTDSVTYSQPHNKDAAQGPLGVSLGLP